jgi:hypothetical protein
MPLRPLNSEDRCGAVSVDDLEAIADEARYAIAEAERTHPDPSDRLSMVLVNEVVLALIDQLRNGGK